MPATAEKPMAKRRAKTVADKLRRLIEAKRPDWTQLQIAERAGMDHRALSRILLGGIKDPRLSTLTAILDAIGATLAEFEQA